MLIPQVSKRFVGDSFRLYGEWKRLEQEQLVRRQQENEMEAKRILDCADSTEDDREWARIILNPENPER